MSCFWMAATRRSMPRKRRGPDFAGRLDAVAAHQLVQLELAVGREKAGAAPGGAAADDVLVDQHHLVTDHEELDGRRDAGEAGADDDHVALDVARERRAMPVLVDEQRGEPPVLIHQA